MEISVFFDRVMNSSLNLCKIKGDKEREPQIDKEREHLKGGKF
jgi:hypothetical protein